MDISRRSFVVGSAAAGVSLAAPRAFGFHQDKPTLKVGLIGCGGRGSGAIRQNLDADPGVVCWAMGDMFPDRLESSLKSLKNDKGDRVQVDGRTFSGFEAYKHVIASGVDVIILATPPGFRPIHFRAAIEAGKHVFFEKPVCVDSWGAKMMLESATISEQKGLTIVAGTQRRHDVAYNECIKRIKDGAIGDVRSMHAYWNQGGLWAVEKKDPMTDMEWQLRNWLYFTWLSGDHIVEQHVHNLDVCNWVMGTHPVKATSLAGRQVRTGATFGHIFDHFATEYEYPNGVKMTSMCRQIDGCASKVAEHIVGATGTSNANTQIKGASDWRFEGERQDPYLREHIDLYKSIRSNAKFNEARQVTESTVTAIMGRMSAYSGQEVSWDDVVTGDMKTMPEHLEFGPLAVPAVAMPGQRQA